MTTEMIYTKERRPQDPEQALMEIRDRAVMLYLAGAYLCESPLLRKLGFNIEQNVEALVAYVAEINEEKTTAHSTNVDSDLERMAHVAELLQTGNEEIRRKCGKGQLGKELCDQVAVLGQRIKAMRGGGESPPLTYGKMGSVEDFFDRLRSSLRFVSASLRVFLKTLGVLFALCLVLFLILFFTMESEKDLLKEVKQQKALILEKGEVLSTLNKALREAKGKIARMGPQELSRQEEVRLMDLKLKIYKLEENKATLKNEMEDLQKTLAHKEKDLQEFRGKSFMENLLRR